MKVEVRGVAWSVEGARILADASLTCEPGHVVGRLIAQGGEERGFFGHGRTHAGLFGITPVGIA